MPELDFSWKGDKGRTWGREEYARGLTFLKGAAFRPHVN
jgi:hypothetical protein